MNTINLFNEIVSFLSKITNSTILLCSATQPLLEKTKRENLLLSEKPDLIAETESYEDKLRRTRIVASAENKSCDELNRQTVVPGSVMRSMMLWLCLRKVILKIIRRFRQCFFWDIHVSGEHLGVKRKRFLKRIIATTDFCNYQSRFIAYK